MSAFPTAAEGEPGQSLRNRAILEHAFSAPLLFSRSPILVLETR